MFRKITDILCVFLVSSMVFHFAYYTYLIDVYEDEEMAQIRRMVREIEVLKILREIGWDKFVQDVHDGRYNK